MVLFCTFYIIPLNIRKIWRFQKGESRFFAHGLVEAESPIGKVFTGACLIDIIKEYVPPPSRVTPDLGKFEKTNNENCSNLPCWCDLIQCGVIDPTKQDIYIYIYTSIAGTSWSLFTILFSHVSKFGISSILKNCVPINCSAYKYKIWDHKNFFDNVINFLSTFIAIFLVFIFYPLNLFQINFTYVGF